jgi:peptidoglycan/LPS O-acetylase OafA/YrhL
VGSAANGQGDDARAIPRRFIAGDALRAIAAMSVLVFHAGVATLLWKEGQAALNGEPDPQQFHPLFHFLSPEVVSLRAGIYIFFVLSGYLLSRPFLAAYLFDAPQPRIGRYFRNRALRIIPAFWVVFTVYLIWNHGADGSGLGGVLAVYAFAQNYHWTPVAELLDQAWTLDIEVAFYILLPVAFFVAVHLRRRRSSPRTRLAWLLGVLVVAYVLSLVARHNAGNPADLTYTIADFLFAFIPGIALAAVEPFAAPRLHGAAVAKYWVWGALALAVCLIAVFVSQPVSHYGLRSILISLGCGALVASPLIYQWSTGGCWRVLDNTVMHWLGERSYGIYLIHLGLMTHVLGHVGNHGLGVTFAMLLVGVTAATLVAADLLWRFVEHPALERRLPWRRSPRVAPEPVGTPS